MTASLMTPLDTLAPRRGADVLLEVLRSEGVKYVFGNPGTTEMPLIDALAATPDIAYVLALQEISAVAMADGYAQATGRPGFVNLHTIGGLGHAMGAMLSAQMSATPLVVTAGQQDQRHSLTDPLLFGDLVSIARPAVKWTREVTHPDQLPALARRAFHDCAAAPSGPVFLSLPMDMMERETTVAVPAPSIIERAAIAGSLEQLADGLAGVLPGPIAVIAGDEVAASGASAEVVALAEMLGAPVFGSSWPGHIPFPTAHALWVGCLPLTAAEVRSRLERFDAVFALGTTSTVAVLYSAGPAIPPACKLYQLSADAAGLGRTYPTAFSSVGDIRASLAVLLPMLGERLAPHRTAIAGLLDDAARHHGERRRALQDQADAERGAPVTTPLVAAAEVVRGIGPDVAIVDEAPATFVHVRSLLNSPSPRQYMLGRGGVLGWGMPAAVGTSLGLDRQPVVCLVGDGAALYAPQALWTAASEKLPVTFVVMNNGGYGILKAFMRSQPGYVSNQMNRYIAMEMAEPSIDFLALAASMGLPARRTERQGDIAGAIEAGIASGRPNLIEIPITHI